MTREEEQKDIDSNKEMAAFSYFLIFSPLLLYTKKSSPFIQFHAKQAVFLFVGGIVFAILGTPFSYANFLVLALCITGIIQANMGSYWRVPIVADILESGISMKTIREIFTHYSTVIRNMFVKTEAKSESMVSKIQSVQGMEDISEIKKLLTLQQERINALNEKLLIHAVLRGKEKKELTKEVQKALYAILENLEKQFPKHKKTSEEGFIRYDFKHFSVFVGAFSEESVRVCFVGDRLKTEVDTVVHFGNNTEEKRITNAIQKLLA